MLRGATRLRVGGGARVPPGLRRLPGSGPLPSADSEAATEMQERRRWAGPPSPAPLPSSPRSRRPASASPLEELTQASWRFASDSVDVEGFTASLAAANARASCRGLK